MSPELYRLLVIDRAWSPARYEHWLTEHLDRPTDTRSRRTLTFCVTAQVPGDLCGDTEHPRDHDARPGG